MQEMVGNKLKCYAYDNLRGGLLPGIEKLQRNKKKRNSHRGSILIESADIRKNSSLQNQVRGEDKTRFSTLVANFFEILNDIHDPPSNR